MLKTETDRNQIQLLSLEGLVSCDSFVRVIDAFVSAMNLKELGFEQKGQIKNGAPAYGSSALLKLYYYGYLNRVRSSRRLEREALTNVEAMWLLKGLRPGYKTIANFRKENFKALENAFKVLNRFLKGQELFDDKVIAVDGSKFRGQNSKKNNYNEKKVKQHLDYIDKQTTKYLQELEELDKEENAQEDESSLEQRIELAEKLDHLHQRQVKYNNLSEQVKEAREKGQTQVSTTDADARALPKKMNIVEVGYNVVTAAESKNKLITNYTVSNESDTYALSGAAIGARSVLEKDIADSLTVLADRGFDTGSELKKCSEANITTIVATKKRTSNKKDKAYGKNVFIYDDDEDTYTCPDQKQLRSNGQWYKKKGSPYRKAINFKRYKLPFKVCNSCSHKLECAGAASLKASRGRHIERSEFEDFIEENTERTKLNKPLYRKRQEIMEHQYGTIKRQWGYDYTLLKTKEKVSGEFAIIFTCYNLRRAITILGVKELIKRIKQDAFFVKGLYEAIANIFRHANFYREFSYVKNMLKNSGLESGYAPLNNSVFHN